MAATRFAEDGLSTRLLNALWESKRRVRSSTRLLRALRKPKLTLEGCYALCGSQSGHSEAQIGCYTLFGSENLLYIAITFFTEDKTDPRKFYKATTRIAGVKIDTT